MAIEADPAWQSGAIAGPGSDGGLAAARAIAMITYRSAASSPAVRPRVHPGQPGGFDADHYLRRQGDKLVARFDAASYVALMRRDGPP